MCEHYRIPGAGWQNPWQGATGFSFATIGY